MKANLAATYGVTAIASVGFMMAGCASSSSSSGTGAGDQTQKPGTPARERLAGRWLAVSIRGNPVDAMMAGVPVQEFPSLSLVEGDRIGGSTAVNRWSAPLDMAKADSGEFVLGPAISTRMAGPPAAMQVESRFLEALAAARTYAIAGGELILIDENGKEMLRFSQVAAK